MSLISVIQFIFTKKGFPLLFYFPFKHMSRCQRVMKFDVNLLLLEKSVPRLFPPKNLIVMQFLWDKYSLVDNPTTTENRKKNFSECRKKSKQTPAQLILDRFSTKRDIFTSSCCTYNFFTFVSWCCRIIPLAMNENVSFALIHPRHWIFTPGFL